MPGHIVINRKYTTRSVLTFFAMGKDTLKEVGEDLKQFAHDEVNAITHHNDKDDVKKKLSHEDKAENFTPATGFTSEGTFVGAVEHATPAFRRARAKYPFKLDARRDS
jgi:hypothetical protein